MSTIDHLLPPDLLLGPHLSAYRYFFVCTLTIASWDTLVLTTRSWRMTKTKEWPALKVLMLLLRHLMPIEFIVLAVACFNPAFTPDVCSKSYLFEPIMTAVIMTLSSLALGIRVRAIYDGEARVTFALATLLVAQVAMHFAACFFYFPLNITNAAGCIAAPKHNWVGIYWVGPCVFAAFCFALAVNRSILSMKERPVGLWKLINRDGLNLYATIFTINLINVIYFFSTRPHDDSDPLKMIVSTLATVLTSTMTMRIILLVRGSLSHGGSFHGSSNPASNSMSGGNGTNNAVGGVLHISGGTAGVRSKGSGVHHGGVAIGTAGSGVGSPAMGNKMSQPTFAVTRSMGGVQDMTVMSGLSVDEDVDVYDVGHGPEGKVRDFSGEDDVGVWEGDKDSQK